MIPEEKNAAVTRGLREAFGVTEIEDIRRLTGGLTSTLVFRIVVHGSPFLLRIIMREDDPARHFTNMRHAAEAGLAPRVLYTSVPDKMSITDFVDSVPLPAADALIRMPAELRTLHALPPFARVPDRFNTSCMFLINKGPALDGFLQRFQAANIVPGDERQEVFGRCAQIAAVYPRHDPDMVSSHNDLKPENILFDGHHIWLVDWEAAFLNDRYADLAALANFLVTTDAEQRVYLHEYFGQPPGEYQLARFFLVQQLVHVFYGAAFLLVGSAGKPASPSEDAPGFTELHRRMWAGEVNLADNPMKIAYGRAHWKQFLQNVRQPQFEESLRIVGGRRARA
jgi:hypothetical protein